MHSPHPHEPQQPRHPQAAPSGDWSRPSSPGEWDQSSASGQPDQWSRPLPPAPPPAVRAIRGLALATVALLSVDLLVGAVAAIVSVSQTFLIDRIIQSPESVTREEIDAADALYGATGIAQSVTQVLTAVVFVVWLFRARANAEALEPAAPHRRTRPWLIFGWVVPIVNLVFPKQIVDDIWTASKPGQFFRSDYGLHRARRSRLVLAWWIAFLISRTAWNVLAWVLRRADDLESLRNAAWAEAFILVPTLVAGVLACMIVLRISGFQEARRAGHGPYNPYDARFTAPVG